MRRNRIRNPFADIVEPLHDFFAQSNGIALALLGGLDHDFVDKRYQRVSWRGRWMRPASKANVFINHLSSYCSSLPSLAYS